MKKLLSLFAAGFCALALGGNLIRNGNFADGHAETKGAEELGDCLWERGVWKYVLNGETKEQTN